MQIRLSSESFSLVSLLKKFQPAEGGWSGHLLLDLLVQQLEKKVVHFVLPENYASNFFLGPFVLLGLSDQPLDELEASQVSVFVRFLWTPEGHFCLSLKVQLRDDKSAIFVLPPGDAGNFLLGPLVLLGLGDQPLDELETSQVSVLVRFFQIPHSHLLLSL